MKCNLESILFIPSLDQYLRSDDGAITTTSAIEDDHAPTFASGSNEQVPHIRVVTPSC